MREGGDEPGGLEGAFGPDHPLGELDHRRGGRREPVERASSVFGEVHEQDPVGAWLSVGEVAERDRHGAHPSTSIRVASQRRHRPGQLDERDVCDGGQQGGPVAHVLVERGCPHPTPRRD